MYTFRDFVFAKTRIIYMVAYTHRVKKSTKFSDTKTLYVFIKSFKSIKMSNTSYHMYMIFICISTAPENAYTWLLTFFELSCTFLMLLYHAQLYYNLISLLAPCENKVVYLFFYSVTLFSCIFIYIYTASILPINFLIKS